MHLTTSTDKIYTVPVILVHHVDKHIMILTQSGAPLLVDSPYLYQDKVLRTSLKEPNVSCPIEVLYLQPQKCGNLSNQGMFTWSKLFGLERFHCLVAISLIASSKSSGAKITPPNWYKFNNSSWRSSPQWEVSVLWVETQQVLGSLQFLYCATPSPKEVGISYPLGTMCQVFLWLLPYEYH